jgi:hypothetical protein
MDTKNVKFIRALWGDYNEFKHEISNQPSFDEMVYVWGEDNEHYLKQLGYSTKLVSKDALSYDDEFIKFKHKIDALQLATIDYGKFIFLDWDVTITKPIDDEFFKYLEGKKFLAPLYAYPIEYLDLYDKLEDVSARLWTNEQIVFMKEYGWVKNDLIIIPNAGFIYCDDPSFAPSLGWIIENHYLFTLIEEFAIFIYANCNLEDYINNYEPLIINGRPDSNVFNLFDIDRPCAKELSEHIKTYLKKDLYLEHN